MWGCRKILNLMSGETHPAAARTVPCVAQSFWEIIMRSKNYKTRQNITNNLLKTNNVLKTISNNHSVHTGFQPLHVPPLKCTYEEIRRYHPDNRTVFITPVCLQGIFPHNCVASNNGTQDWCIRALFTNTPSGLLIPPLHNIATQVIAGCSLVSPCMHDSMEK